MSIQHIAHLPQSFRLEHGARVAPTLVAYSCEGPRGRPAVVALGGISAGANLAGPQGWWCSMIGPCRPIDTARFQVIGIDFIGGRGRTGAPLPIDCPVTTADQAAAIAAVLDRLRIRRVHSVIGASYGGMVALAFARRCPERLEHAVVISAAHEPDPMTTALRSLQRRIVKFGVETGNPRKALELARGLAMTTYRTSEEFRSRFASAPSSPARWPVEDYLEASGHTWAATWTPTAFLTLSLSLDLHRVNPAEIQVPVTLVAVKGDRLVPLYQMEDLYRALPRRAGFHLVDSPYGHDAFLKETGPIGFILQESLAREAA